tara:strand:+ start:2049 stop:3716 length:1668 start_codon:yes stop_codon:yes gene_type:complete
MFLIELLIFVLFIIILSISISGYGSLYPIKIRRNFFLDILLGFIIISLLITIFHFFFKINLFLNTLIFLIGLVVFFKKNKFFYFSKFIKKSYIFNIAIFLLLIPIFISQKYHEDFGYYHLPYALAFLEEKIVFGFANINQAYVYNSIWLNLYPLFFLENKNFNFLTLPSFLLLLSFIMFSLNKVLEKKNVNISDFYLITTLFYFLLKFTRISEYGVDFPATIYSIISIFFFIKFYETSANLEKKSFFYLNFIFSIFSILIKLSTIPVIILPIYLYFTNFKNFKFYVFESKFLIIYFLFIVFFVQQFIYTGCILFPTNFTCFNASWFNSENINLSKKLELINKSYSLARTIYPPEEYLNNFTWFSFWFKRSLNEILEHLMTMVIPLLLFFLFLKKRKKNISLSFNKKKILLLFSFVSLFFWLNFSPVFRFAIYIFITLVFLIFLDFFILREFSKKKFTVFIVIFLIFNFSKNIARIYESEKIFLGIQKIENEYLFNEDNSNEYASIYYPDVKKNTKKNGWQGRLCWNTPFICSSKKLIINKKNGYLIINELKNKND